MGRGRTGKGPKGDSAEGGYEASRKRRDPVTVIKGFVHSFSAISLAAFSGAGCCAGYAVEDPVGGGASTKNTSINSAMV